MSETLDLGLLGRRVEIIQNEVHDILRRMIALGERFTAQEGRTEAIEKRMTALEGRMVTFEDRLDDLADRMAKLEEQNAVGLFILRKLAAAQGIEVP
jgi:chromosome segregation ATPase